MSVQRIIVHHEFYPSFQQAIQQKSRGQVYEDPLVFGGIPIEVSQDDFPRVKSGRWIQPDGQAVLPEDICIESRFVHYGPEDIELLRFAELIKEETVPGMVLINMPNPFEGPMIPQFDRSTMRDIQIRADPFYSKTRGILFNCHGQ